jgi:hypothetical protein
MSEWAFLGIYGFIGATIAYFVDRRGIDWYVTCVLMWPYLALFLLFNWIRKHWG